MSDNTSVIDAVRLIAKATKDDSTKLSDIVKGALRPDQIDDMRLRLSRARDGSVVHGAATTSAAASAPAASAAAGPRDTSVQRRAWKGGANKASAKFQGIPPTSESSLTAASSSLRYLLLPQPGPYGPLTGPLAGPVLVGGLRRPIRRYSPPMLRWPL